MNIFYLSQGFTNVLKRTIRNNVNFIIIFKQNNNDIEYIRRSYVGDIDVKQFKDWVDSCTREEFAYCVIDLSKTEEKEDSGLLMKKENN